MNGFQGVPPGLCRRVGGGVESRLLAERVRGMRGERLAELGSGCGEGVVRVALANPYVLVDGLELQEVLNRAARELVEVHGVADRVRIWTGDVRRPPGDMIEGGYAQVFCNPPFFLPGQGRIPSDPLRAAARFELTASLRDFMVCGSRLLKQGGMFHLVHRPERLVEILLTMQGCGLTPCCLVPVRDQWEGPLVLVLISARKGGREGLTLEAAQLIGCALQPDR